MGSVAGVIDSKSTMKILNVKDFYDKFQHCNVFFMPFLVCGWQPFFSDFILSKKNAQPGSESKNSNQVSFKILVSNHLFWDNYLYRRHSRKWNWQSSFSKRDSNKAGNFPTFYRRNQKKKYRLKVKSHQGHGAHDYVFTLLAERSPFSGYCNFSRYIVQRYD